MKQLKVMIDLGGASVSAHNSLTGKVWLTFDGQSFPEEKWSDLILPVVGDWCHSLSELCHMVEGEAKLSFVDGPFAAIVTVKESLWRIVFKNTYTGVAKHGGQFEPRIFFRSLIAACNTILKHCSSHDWEPKHLAYLETNLAALSKVNQ